MSAIHATTSGSRVSNGADSNNATAACASTDMRASAAPGLSGAQLSLGIVSVILCAVLWIGPDRVGAFANGMLQAYIDAQQSMLEASSNLTKDGRAEFAVLLGDGASAGDLRAALSTIDDVSFAREADLSGWVVVTTTAGNRDALQALSALPQSRLVVPNRGLWICH
jgi:hypothetical protein